MKAVVVEIKNNKAAVLSDDGCVVTVKNKDYEVGQVILMINPKAQITKKLAVFAASAAAFVILGTGAWAYATPYTYVSIDVNPSIEYTVNRFDRVLSVNAVNDDGEEIIQEIALDNLKNQTIEAALRKTMEQITTAGYFAGTVESGLVIATASENEDKADELAATLQQVAEEEINEANEDVIVEAYSVGLTRVEEARELGVTPGKLNLVEKLQASSADPSTIDIEEWLNKPVKEIMKATKDNRNASTVSDSDSSDKEDQNDQEDQKDLEKSDKADERKEQKLQKEEEKASDKAAKAEKKIKAKEDKSKEKNLDAQEKISEKEESTREKSKDSKKNSQDREKEDKIKNKDQNNLEKSGSTKEDKTDNNAQNTKVITDQSDQPLEGSTPSPDANSSNDGNSGSSNNSGGHK